MEVECEQWHCPEHRDLAQPGDLEEHVPAIIGLTGSGAPVYSAKERRSRAEWVKKDEADRERERRQREEHDKAMAEATEAARERFREEGVISILGVKCRPDGRLIR